MSRRLRSVVADDVEPGHKARRRVCSVYFVRRLDRLRRALSRRRLRVSLCVRRPFGALRRRACFLISALALALAQASKYRPAPPASWLHSAGAPRARYRKPSSDPARTAHATPHHAARASVNVALLLPLKRRERCLGSSHAQRPRRLRSSILPMIAFRIADARYAGARPPVRECRASVIAGGAQLILGRCFKPRSSCQPIRPSARGSRDRLLDREQLAGGGTI